LIACKGSPAVNKEKKYMGYRAVYRFDLGKMKLLEEPEILVDLTRRDCYKYEIYLISSVVKILIIMDRYGKVLDLKEMDSKIFRQPEGICFSAEGDLLISSEGKGGDGYILRFKLKKVE
jgi:hypothetical protein